MTVQAVYDHIADFIASMDPKSAGTESASSISIRLEDLIDKEKEGNLTLEEKDELDHYVVLERLIRLAKAHARLRLSQG
ncbi:MAG: hypothetical protein IPH16_05150 [Haliscomenobacter sp.]|nr:hypothetical protein [Haliscomenobacter sp.]